MEVGRIWVIIAADITGFRRSVETARGMVENLQSAVDKATGGSRILAGGLTAVGAAAGGAALAGVKLAADYETANVAFKNLLGSSEKASKFLGDLEKFADVTPFRTDQLQKSAQMLLNANVAAKDIIPTMTAVGDAIANAGRGPEEVQSAILAMTQTINKGKISLEELNQMQEAGIPAAKYMAAGLGMQTSTLQKLLEKGAIPAQRGIQAMIIEMERVNKGAMNTQSLTLWGKWSTTQEKLMKTTRAFGQVLNDTFNIKGKLDMAINGLTSLSDKMETFRTIVQKEGLQAALERFIPPALRQKVALVAGAIGGMLVPAVISAGAAFVTAALPLLPFAAAGVLIVKNWENVRPMLERLAPVATMVRRVFTNSFGLIRTDAPMMSNRVQESVRNASDALQSLSKTKVNIKAALDIDKVEKPSWIDNTYQWFTSFYEPWKGLGARIAKELEPAEAAFKRAFSSEGSKSGPSFWKAQIEGLVSAIVGLPLAITNATPGSVRALAGITEEVKGWVKIIKGLLTLNPTEFDKGFDLILQGWADQTKGRLASIKGFFNGFFEEIKAGLRAMGLNVDAELRYDMDLIKSMFIGLKETILHPIQPANFKGFFPSLGAESRLDTFLGLDQGRKAADQIEKVMSAAKVTKTISGVKKSVPRFDDKGIDAGVAAAGQALYNLQAQWDKAGMPKTVAATQEAITAELLKLDKNMGRITANGVAKVLAQLVYMDDEAVRHSIIPDMVTDINRWMGIMASDMPRQTALARKATLDEMARLSDISDITIPPVVIPMVLGQSGQMPEIYIPEVPTITPDVTRPTVPRPEMPNLPESLQAPTIKKPKIPELKFPEVLKAPIVEPIDFTPWMGAIRNLEFPEIHIPVPLIDGFDDLLGRITQAWEVAKSRLKLLAVNLPLPTLNGWGEFGRTIESKWDAIRQTLNLTSVKVPAMVPSGFDTLGVNLIREWEATRKSVQPFMRPLDANVTVPGVKATKQAKPEQDLAEAYAMIRKAAAMPNMDTGNINSLVGDVINSIGKIQSAFNKADWNKPLSDQMSKTAQVMRQLFPIMTVPVSAAVAKVLFDFGFMKNDLVDHSIVPDMVRDIDSWMGIMATDMPKKTALARKATLGEMQKLSDMVEINGILMTKSEAARYDSWQRVAASKMRSMRDDGVAVYGNMNQNLIGMARRGVNGIYDAWDSLGVAIGHISEDTAKNAVEDSTNMLNQLSGSTATGLDRIIAPYKSMFDKLKEWWDNLPINATLKTKMMQSSVSGLVELTRDSVVGNIRDTSQNIIKSLKESWDRGINPWATAWDALKNGTDKGAGIIKAAFQSIKDAVWTTAIQSTGRIGKMISVFRQMGTEEAKLAADGMANLAAHNAAWDNHLQAVKAASMGIATSITDYFDNLRAQKGKIDDIQKAIDGLIANGFGPQSKALQNLRAEQDRLKLATGTAWNDIKKATRDATVAVLTAIEQQVIAQKVLQAVTNLWFGNVLGFITSSAEVIAVAAGFELLKNAVYNAFPEEPVNNMLQATQNLGIELNKITQKYQLLGDAGYSQRQRLQDQIFAYQSAIDTAISQGATSDNATLKEWAAIQAGLQAQLNALPLAKGGIVTRPTFALVGEAGPEAVIPLSRGRNQLAAVGGGGGGATLNFYNTQVLNDGDIDKFMSKVVSIAKRKGVRLQ